MPNPQAPTLPIGFGAIGKVGRPKVGAHFFSIDLRSIPIASICPTSRVFLLTLYTDGQPSSPPRISVHLGPPSVMAMWKIRPAG